MNIIRKRNSISTLPGIVSLDLEYKRQATQNADAYFHFSVHVAQKSAKDKNAIFMSV
mgnify:FL=1